MPPGWSILSDGTGVSAAAAVTKTMDPGEWALPLEVLEVVGWWVVESLKENFTADPPPHPRPKITPLLSTSPDLLRTLLPALYRHVSFTTPQSLPRLYRFLTNPAVASYAFVERVTLKGITVGLPQHMEELRDSWKELGEGLRDRERRGEGGREEGRERVFEIEECDHRLEEMYRDCFTFPTVRIKEERALGSHNYESFTQAKTLHLTGSVAHMRQLGRTLVSNWSDKVTLTTLHLSIFRSLNTWRALDTGYVSAPTALDTGVEMDQALQALSVLAGKKGVEEITVKVVYDPHTFCEGRVWTAWEGRGEKKDYKGFHKNLKLRKCEGECYQTGGRD